MNKITRNIAFLLALFAFLAMGSARASSSYLIEVVDAKGKTVKQVHASADGSFEVKNLKAETYRVKVKLPMMHDEPSGYWAKLAGSGRYSYEVVAPKDRNTGAASGKLAKPQDNTNGQPTSTRQHKPCVITQNWSVVDDNLVIETDGSILSGKLKVVGGRD
jgi:hypothetical protein